MDTEKSLEKTLNEQKITNAQTQVQQSEQEQTGNSVGMDWVVVDKQKASNSRVVRMETSEVESLEKPKVKKAMGEFTLYQHRHLTEEDLEYNYYDAEKDRVKIAELKTFDFNQLADWAFTNAKVRGADAAFIKLVENLINLKDLEEEMLSTDSYEAVKVCREMFEEDINSLSSNVDSYYNGHNKFIVFTEKGKLRLQLCKSLKTMIKGGLEQDLRKKADEVMNIQLGRIPLKQKYEGPEKDFILHKKYTAESEDWVEKYNEQFSQEVNFYDSVKQKVPEFGPFEDKVCKKVDMITRKHLRTLFKHDSPDSKEWNANVEAAVLAYIKDGDETLIYSIVEKMITEVADYKCSLEMVDEEYAFKHPKEYYHLERLSLINGDLIDKTNFGGILSECFDKIKEEKPELYERFVKNGDLVNTLYIFQGKTMQYHGIDSEKLKNKLVFNRDSELNKAEYDSLQFYIESAREKISKLNS